MFVDSESCVSPSAFGTMEVTFHTGQHFRVPRCLQTNNDDTCDDRRVLVDDDINSAVVVVDGLDSGSGDHSECVSDASSDSQLVNRCELSIFHSTLWTFIFYNAKITLEHIVICEQSSRTYTCRE